MSDAVEQLFLELAEGRVAPARTARCGGCACCTRRSSTARSRARRCRRLLPGGLAEKLRNEGRHIGETEELEVTVLMSDIRGYSTIAERTDPTQLAGQLNEHRAAMNGAILGDGGTVMQFVGDAVMAVFGAPFPQRRPRRPGACDAAHGDAPRARRR